MNNVCNICGANYVFKNGRWVCPACGAYKPEELSNEEVTLLYNAQQQLRLADFDEAESLYRDIIEKYPDNHEGYWGLVLAKYGIKYEQDYNGKMIPTCYAASYESVLRDKNYLRALELCDGDERRYLEEQADKIERIRREWVEQASKEPAYDIFLSYKDTESGTGSERTKDSYEAKELYDELTRLGYRVFFSRESLKGKAGENFEPYIFNALNTAHVMIVYGSRPEYFEATWIKNEWSRFLKRINNGEKQKNALIVVYHDLNPKDLVSPLNRLQGIDRKRLDFSRVLEKYCEKVVSAAKTVIPKIDRVEIGTRTGRTVGKVAKLETVELKRRDTAKSEIKRETVERREIGQYTLPPLTAAEENQLSVANAYLASGNFDDAEKIYSAVLENNPQNGSAIVGLLFTAARSKGFDEFGTTGVRNFTSWDRFEKALAFSDAGTSEKLLSAFVTEAYRALRAGETEKSKAIYSHIENYDSESVSRLRRESCTYVLDLIVKDTDTAAFFIDAYLLYEADTDRYIETLSTVVKRAVKEGKFEFAEKYQKEWLSYAEDEYASNLAALEVRFKTRTEDGVLDAIENAGEFSALETVLKGLNAESAARLFIVISKRVISIVLSDRENVDAALGWIRAFFKYDFAERTSSIRGLLHTIRSSPDARRAEIFDLLLMMSDADEETTYELYKDYADKIRLAGDFVLADRYYGKAIDVRETEECWKGRLMCHLGVPAAADYPKKIGLLSDWTIVETILSLLTPSDRIHFLNKMLEYALAALSLPGTKHETIVSIADKFFSYFSQESDGELTRHLAAFAEKLKELKQFAFAERMYATLLGFDNRNHVAYWGLLQAKLKCRNENELVKQPVPLSDLSEFTNALLAAGSNAEAMQRYIGIQNRQRAWLERVEKRKKALRKLRRISAIAGICAAVALVIAGVIFGIVSYHETESGLKYKRDGEGVSVSAGKYYKSSEVLVIPSESEGLPVVSVKKGGFRGHDEIREVVLPDTLIAIGDEAFAGCTNLESVTFADRSSTASFVVVPRLASAAPGAGNAALSRLSVIGARAFQGCAKLTEITLPQGLTSIGDEAFADTGLVSVTIPETVVSVGKKVFENCEQLTEIRVVNRDEIPAEWDENWGGNVEEKIVYSLRVLLDYSKTDDPSHVGAALAFVFFGENYNLPVPTRAGYVFNGWYRGDVQLTNESGVSLSVWGFEDGGMATPSFTANENTIFFNGNGETSGDTHSQKLHTDETGALNANGFVRDGYTFLGWSTEQNGMVEYLDEADFKMSAEPSLVLYAVWEANRNTLHFNANGGEGSMQDIKVKTDSTAILPACAYSIPGYDFCGWALEPTGTPIYEDEAELKMGTEPSLILYAVWEATPNLLVFDANGGEGSMQTLRLQTDATSAIPACTYSMRGYDFCGWAAEPDGEIVFHSGDSYTMGTNPSYTLYAVWQMATYTVTYALNNGTVDENPTSYTIESALFTLNQPSRPGYVFIGWSGTDLSQPTKTVTIPSNSVGNRTYTANWEANLNTLHFNANGGEGTMSDLSIRTDATSDLPVCSLSRRGYAFVGWSTTEDGTASVNDHASYQMGTESEYTLYAVWEILSFRIVCDSQNGTISEDEFTAEYGSTPTLPVPVLDHYVFGGWYSAIGGGGTQYADSTGAFVAPFEDCEDLNLYAYWKCSVALTYKYSNGSYGIKGVSGNYSTGFSSVGPKTIYLPDYYNGYPVTSILQDCFKDRNALETIYISSNIVSIDQSAFSGCTGLTSIIVSDNNGFYHSEGNCLIATSSKTLVLGCQTSIIPSNGSVTIIGDGAFKGCSELTSIIIPDSVILIGESVFEGCSSLRSLTIPFVGNRAGITSNDTYRYPLGYLFGTNSFSASTATKQKYYAESTTSVETSTYYIPNLLLSVTVTGGNIFYGAFKNCSRLTSISISEKATILEEDAFYGCSRLSEFIIPAGVVTIGSGAFYGCAALSSIVIPDSVETIEPGAFSGCSGLSSITLGNRVSTIGSEAFAHCSGLTSLIIPDSVTSLGQSAFSGCSGLTTISIGNGIASIGKYVFDGCYFTDVTVPTASWLSLFSKTNLQTVVITGGNTINQAALSGCSTLTSIVIPNGVTKIEGEAFKGCTGLTSITIPDSVTSIEFEAFSGCSGLTSVIIPNGVTSIGDAAFSGCSSLQSITIPFVGASAGITSSSNYQFPFGYLFGTSSYSEAYGVAQTHHAGGASSTTTTTYYIPSSLKSVTITGGEILCGAFQNCSGLTSIIFPDNITSIGEYAFQNCSGLRSISIPSCVTSIGAYAFSGCSGLTAISIPDGIAFIEAGVFKNCAGLTAIAIPDSVTSIGSNAFSGCSGLTLVTIPEGVTRMVDQAFEECTGLTSVIWNATNCYVYVGDEPNGVFYGCVNLTSILIANTVITIPSCAFATCPISSIIIPDSVVAIGSYAFYNCSALTAITIPESVETISDYAFSGCTGLTSVIVPDSVSRINNGLFYNCSSLTSVTVPDSVTNIGASVFYGCIGLTSITIPDSVLYIEEGAFSGCSSLQTLTIPFVGGSRKTASDTYQYPFGYIFGKSSYSGGVATTQTYHSSTSTTSDTYYIPSSLKSVTVTSGDILYGAFYNCSDLMSIIIGNNVTSIENDVFHNCPELESVTIGTGVTSIGGPAFYNCSKLTLVVWNAINCTSEGTSLHPVFFGCSNLTTLRIGDEVQIVPVNENLGCDNLQYNEYDNALYLGNEHNPYIALVKAKNTSIESCIIYPQTKIVLRSAFSGCSNLASIIIPDSVTSIEQGAFFGCSSLQTLTIPFVGGSRKTETDTYQYPFGYIFGTNSYAGGVETTQHYYGNSTRSTTNTTYYIPSSLRSVTVTGGNILRGAFSGCPGLISVILPASATSIGGRAFDGCSSLVSITIPGNVLSIDNDAFADCTSLNSVILPEGLTSIAHAAFSNCSGLSEIIIPGSVTNIGSQAFRGCSGLISITIPKSVTSIGSRPFERCSALMTINVEFGNPVYHSFGNCLIETNSKKLIAGCNSSVIPNDGSVTSIEEGAFFACSELTLIAIPGTITSIGNEAFRGCANLNSVSIGDGVASIGSYVFAECSSLDTVTFANITGWYVREPGASSSKNVTVTNPSTNATYFKSTYLGYSWFRE